LSLLLSSALCPLCKLHDAGLRVIYTLANWNPFRNSGELIRCAANGQFNTLSCTVVVGTGHVAFGLALRGYNPLIGDFGQVRRD